MIPDSVLSEVNEFYYYAEHYGVKYRRLKGVVLLDHLHNHYAGVAKGRYIYLDTTSYNWRTERKRLVFHEMGHACLNRGDNEVSHKSIMNYGVKDWKENEAYYICELFNRTPCSN